MSNMKHRRCRRGLNLLQVYLIDRTKHRQSSSEGLQELIFKNVEIPTNAQSVLRVLLEPEYAINSNLDCIAALCWQSGHVCPLRILFRHVYSPIFSSFGISAAGR